MLQLSPGQTYVDVCPLLLPYNESSDGNYSQPVAVERNLVVSGKNFPVSALSFLLLLVRVYGNLALSLPDLCFWLLCQPTVISAREYDFTIEIIHC